MYRQKVSISELAHCKFCWEPMRYIYDEKCRDVCYECELEIELEHGVKKHDNGRI